MMWKYILQIVVLISSISLSACSVFSPGMHVPHGMQGKSYGQSAADVKQIANIPVININPQSIQTNNLLLENTYLTHDESSRLNNNIEHKPYLIAAGDELVIMVWQHQDLNNPVGASATFEQLSFRVQENGDIIYPYVGHLKVAGKTEVTVQRELSKRLAAFIKEPQLTVKVLEFLGKHANIVGTATQPIVIPITNIPGTVIDAINQSGATTTTSDLRDVTLIRNGQTYKLNLRTNDPHFMVSHLIIRDKDLIDIPDKTDQHVYVLGEVQEPVTIPYETFQMTLSRALATAKGLNLNQAQPGLIFVLRKNYHGRPIAFRLKAKNPATLVLASQFKLMPDDIVYVGTNSLALWARVFDQLYSTSFVVRNTDSVLK